MIHDSDDIENEEDEEAGCTGGCSSCAGCSGIGETTAFAQSPRDVTVEYLYLDLETCERCIDTKDVLDEVIHEISPVLEMTGIRLTYVSVNIATRKLAEEYHFRTSPTILVNGRDIEDKIAENHCSACGAICDGDTDCRTWEFEGKHYDVLPKSVLTGKILEMIFNTHASAETDTAGCCPDSDEYVLPANLVKFFEGKSK